MRFKTSPFTAMVAVLIASLSAPSVARAQTDYYWNAPTGGAGTWNTATANWSTTSAGPTDYTWTNSGSERANFGGTGDTVTLGTAITAHSLVFSATGYTIAGDTLTLAGAGGVIDTGTFNATINSVIAGSVGLTKSGTGTLILGGTNTFTGATAVSGGTLQAGVNNAIGSGAVTVAAGSVLNLGATEQTVASLGGAGSVTTAAGGRFTINGGGNSVWTGVMSGAGATVVSNGTLTLSTTQTWTGTLGVNTGGVIQYGNQTNLNTASTAAITLDGGTLYNTNTGNAGTFSPVNRPVTLGAGGGTFRWEGNATNTSLIIVQTTGSAPDFVGTVINGPGGLTKTGFGTIAVAAPAISTLTYEGDTRVSQGILRVRTSSNVFPTGTNLIIDAPGIFDVNNLGQTVNSLSGSGVLAIVGGSLTVNGSATTTFSGLIANSLNAGTTATGTLTKAGTGTLILTGNSSVGQTLQTGNAAGITSVFNPYRANFSVTGGVLQINSDTNLGVAPAAATAGKVTLNGGTLTAASSFELSSNRGVTIGSTGTAGVGTIGVLSGATMTYGGIIANNGAGTGNFAKAGPGTLILSGANTYTGTTTINDGTLLANNTAGSGTGTGAVTVATAGTLGGTGTIAGAVTIAGTLAPGASIGQLTVDNNVTFSTGSSLAAELGANASSTADNLRLTGTARILNFGATGDTTLRLSPDGFTGSAGGPATFVLASLPADGVVQVNAAPATGTIGSFVVGSGSSGPVTINPSLLTGLVTGDSFQLTSTGTAVTLTFTPVPEPATVLGLSALAAGAFGALRRRRR